MSCNNVIIKDDKLPRGKYEARLGIGLLSTSKMLEGWPVRGVGDCFSRLFRISTGKMCPELLADCTDSATEGLTTSKETEPKSFQNIPKHLKPLKVLQYVTTLFYFRFDL